MKKVLFDVFLDLIAWGVAWSSAAGTWLVFDAVFGLFTLTWTLLFVLAAAQVSYLKNELRKEIA